MPLADRDDGEILVSAGGGAVGFPLLAAAIRAKKLTRHRHRRWRIVTGANLPAAERAQLDKLAAGDPDIAIEGFRNDFARLLAACHLSISQGGYNTVMELIATRCPSVVVPFAEGGESEQTLRARMLVERAGPEHGRSGVPDRGHAGGGDRRRAAAGGAGAQPGRRPAKRGAADRRLEAAAMSSWEALGAASATPGSRGRRVAARSNCGGATTTRSPTPSPAPPARRSRTVPVALAVIPARLEPSLPALLKSHGSVSVLQHGFDHQNRAPAGGKKSEFPATRSWPEIADDLGAGPRPAGERVRPAVRARFDAALEPDRSRPRRPIGTIGISRPDAPICRAKKPAVAGVTQVNTHVDVIDWHGTRGFLGLAATLQLLVQHLAAKRLGQADPAEPTGLLTHHLVHDTETEEFLGALLDWCAKRPVIKWRSAADLFPGAGS